MSQTQPWVVKVPQVRHANLSSWGNFLDLPFHRDAQWCLGDPDLFKHQRGPCMPPSSLLMKTLQRGGDRDITMYVKSTVVFLCHWLYLAERPRNVPSLSLQLPDRATHTRRNFSVRKKIILNYCLGQCLLSQNRTILYMLSWSKSSLGLRLKWGSLLIPKPEPTSRDLLTIQPNTRVQGSCGQHHRVWCPEWPERQGAETGLHAETWVLSTQRTHHKQEESG